MTARPHYLNHNGETAIPEGWRKLRKGSIIRKTDMIYGGDAVGFYSCKQACIYNTKVVLGIVIRKIKRK